MTETEKSGSKRNEKRLIKFNSEDNSRFCLKTLDFFFPSYLGHYVQPSWCCGASVTAVARYTTDG